jgi:ribose-phosphate pyrophosphokinase
MVEKGSAKKVTAVLPLFPYSRQPDLPYNKAGAPLSKSSIDLPRRDFTFESVPVTPGPGLPKSLGLVDAADITHLMGKASLSGGTGNSSPQINPEGDSGKANINGANGVNTSPGNSAPGGYYTAHNYGNPSAVRSFQAKPGYRQWVAQAGTLVANLLTCAGADHIVGVFLGLHPFLSRPFRSARISSIPPLLIPLFEVDTDSGRLHCK